MTLTTVILCCSNAIFKKRQVEDMSITMDSFDDNLMGFLAINSPVRGSNIHNFMHCLRKSTVVSLLEFVRISLLLEV